MPRYTPILLSKTGELNALANLTHLHKTQTIPLLQVLRDTNDKRQGSYVDKITNGIITAWGFFDNRIYLDISDLGNDINLIEAVFSTLLDARINIIPVVYPDTPNSHIAIFKKSTYHGICLRFKANNVDASTIERTVIESLSNFSISPSQIDLLIDFGFVTDNNYTHCINSFDLVYSRLSTAKGARRIIIGAGSFPTDLNGFTKDTVSAITRVEWAMWQAIKKAHPDVELIYADYGVSHPMYDPESAKYAGTCTIKYSTQDSFYIFKGEKPGNSALSTGQYQVKAKDLTSKPYYSGNTFSWGDDQIMERATKRENPGGSTTWIAISQNHHMTKMLSLLG